MSWILSSEIESAQPFPDYQEYMNSSGDLPDYQDLMENSGKEIISPNIYNGKVFRIKGEIFQVLSDEQRFLMKTDYNGLFWSDNIVSIEYGNNKNTFKPWEKDVVSVIAKGNGVYSYWNSNANVENTPNLTSLQIR